jgi:hypothetical protein
LVDAMVSCRAHLITTLRAKTEYVMEKNANGKTEIKKLGMAAIQRDGIEYEFTLVGDMDLSNTLRISKTRLDGVIMPGDVFERPGAALASKIYDWLMTGKEAPRPATPPPVVAKQIEFPPAGELVKKLADSADEYIARIKSASDIPELEKRAAGPGKPPKGSEEHKAATLAYRNTKARLAEEATQAGQA